MYQQINPLVSQGWQCPVCKAVYSPTTSICFNCRGSFQTPNQLKGNLGLAMFMNGDQEVKTDDK